jgi:hypothetical protein
VVVESKRCYSEVSCGILKRRVFYQFFKFFILMVLVTVDVNALSNSHRLHGIGLFYPASCVNSRQWQLTVQLLGLTLHKMCYLCTNCVV